MGDLSMTAIAAFGNWQSDEISTGYISKVVIRDFYEEVGEITIPYIGLKKIFKLKTNNFYILGDFVTRGTETKFEEIFQIQLSKTNIPNIAGDFYNVDGVKVPDTIKGRGVATSMYKYFIKNLKMNILGDEIQYFGARKLWARLSKSVDVTVDIIDISTGSFLEKNVILHHGDDDWDFDDRVWSYDVDKKNIRLILKDIT
jgi:hypothetical protein